MNVALQHLAPRALRRSGSAFKVIDCSCFRAPRFIELKSLPKGSLFESAVSFVRGEVLGLSRVLDVLDEVKAKSALTSRISSSRAGSLPMPHPSAQEHKQTQSLVPHDAEALAPVKAQDWPIALELAGERLITTYGKRWMLGAMAATATLGPAWALLLHTQAKHAVEPSKLLVSGLITAACGVLMGSCLLAWPKIIHDAWLLLGAELPQEPAWRTFSLTKTLKRTFGPIIILITPPSILLAIGFSWLVVAWDGFTLSALLLLGVLFCVLALLGWFSLSFLGVAVAGKQALDQHRTLRQHRALSGPEAIGALALSAEHVDDAGALSLSQDAGQLTSSQNVEEM